MDRIPKAFNNSAAGPIGEPRDPDEARLAAGIRLP